MTGRLLSTRAPGAMLLLAALAACGDGGGDGLSDPESEPPRPVSIAVSPESATLASLGQTAAFTATARDQYGAAFPGTVTWSGNAPEVFAVGRFGTVTASGNGAGVLTASLQGLSATARITVAQVPATVEVVSGDEQRGAAGAALPDPVAVTILDAGGSPTGGIAVTFTPAEGHGSVDPASGSTDARGRAETRWTLGDAVGRQSLLVSADEASATIRAMAERPAFPDLVVELEPESVTVAPGDATPIYVFVRNVGDRASGTTTLRYLRSEDAGISTGDRELGTFPLAALLPSEQRRGSVFLTVPEVPQTFYFGACVDSVEAEVSTENNCSPRAVRITVARVSGDTTYTVGQTVETLPTGDWSPDHASGVGYDVTGGVVTITFGSGGYIEEGNIRYTCLAASGGCQIVDRRVTRGSIRALPLSYTAAVEWLEFPTWKLRGADP